MKNPFTRRKPPEGGESGAMNDLSFILIVFFIVIAGFGTDRGFLVSLPDPATPKVAMGEDLLRVSLSATGALSLGGREIADGELKDAILAKKAKYPNMTFLLVVDPDAPWQSVVEAIQDVRGHKVENFSFGMGGSEP